MSDKAEMVKRYASVKLALNFSALHGGDVAECNPGGSIICDPGTGGCGGSPGLSCVGSSCKNDSSFLGCGIASEVFDPGIDSHILVERKELKLLRNELQQVMKKFSKG